LTHGGRPTQNADSAVLDEAFAELPMEMSDQAPVDGGAQNLGDTKNSSENLLGHIAAEVAALNRRCAHLSDMLCRLEMPANANR
jgi:hypothetical protein